MDPPSEHSTGYASAPSAPIDPTYATPGTAPPAGGSPGITQFPGMAGGPLKKLTSPVALLIIVLWHFFWSTWANIEFVDADEKVALSWLPLAWFFHTYLLLGVGVWAVADTRSISALAFMLFMAISIFTEWIMFGAYFDHSKEYLDNLSGENKVSRIANAWHFAWAAALINHLTKYASTTIVALAFRERGGGMAITAARRSYDEIPGASG